MSVRWMSIRARVILALSAVTAITIGLSAVLGVALLSGFLDRRVESRLTTVGDRIGGALAASDGLTIDAESLARFVANGQAAIVESNGATIDAVGIAPADVDAVRAAAESSEPVRVDDRYMVIGLPLEPGDLMYETDAGTATIDHVVIAVDTTDDAATIANVVTTSMIVTVVSIAALIALASIIVGRGLRPLDAMADHASRVAEGDRAIRLPTPQDDPAMSRLASTVNAAFDAQQDAENRMRTFIADASHELRTPITSASGWIDLYLQGGLTDPTDRDDALLRVETQLSRMRQLVDELSLLARTDAGRPLDVELVDLEALATEIVADARIVSPDREIRLETDGRAPVWGDPARLAQVLRNLVGNAAQHTPAGTSISVTVSTGPEYHTVRVSDAGQGIAAADLAHVFDRFWRQDSSRSRDSGGSGLGLSIVRSLLAAHGGEVRGESTPGHGTTFTVTIPAADDKPATGRRESQLHNERS